MTIATPLPEKKSAPLKVEPPLFENSGGGSTPPPLPIVGGGGGGGAMHTMDSFYSVLLRIPIIFKKTAFSHHFYSILNRFSELR